MEGDEKKEEARQKRKGIKIAQDEFETPYAGSGPDSARIPTFFGGAPASLHLFTKKDHRFFIL